MAIQKEIWVQDIQEKLFAGIDFINKSVNHDQFVTDKTVHVPQAGTIPAVQKDRAVLPATIDQRTDTDRDYDLAEFTTDPMLIRNIDKIQLSYDKRASVLSQHMRKMNDRLALEALYQWAGSTLITADGQIILTTGAAAANLAPPGGTGNRKGVLLKDIADAASKMDSDDVPEEGRYLIFPAKPYWDFVNINKAQLLNLDYNKSLSNQDIATGIVAKVYGFNIIKRSYTAVYADAVTPTIKAVGAATAVTDVFGIIGYQEDMVAKALGEIKMFENLDDPVYYGDVYSILVMMAAKTLRTDGKGIVTVVQDT